MGLRCRSGVALECRLRTSFWTSVGIGCSLLVAHELQRIRTPRALDATPAGAALNGAGPDAAPPADARLLGAELYPEDLLLNRPYREDPNRWLVFLHVIGIGYMLLGLNTVCDVYFTGALEEMVTDWNVMPDVAGATFMAAGGSAPEFFTSLIGTTIAMNDVGFSTIVGSAVFNVLFVIGICGYVAKEAIELTWWPLFRDCTYYILGLSLLAIFASNEKIDVWEAIILFLAYLMYCVIMYNNPRLLSMVDSKLRKAKKQVAPETSYAVTGGSGQPNSQGPSSLGAPGATNYGKFENEVDLEEADTKVIAKVESTPASPVAMIAPPPGGSPDPEATPEAPEATPELPVAAPEAPSDKGSQGSESEEEESGNFMDRPEGTLDQITWFMSLPVFVPLWYLTPEPTGDTVHPHVRIPMFLVTFFISLIWIAGFSFLLVWWVEILGDVLHIDEIIMGFTVLAAGTSIPDAVSSMGVAARGHGDMAVSSSIGSNIFDILVGLPVPWIIKTGIIEGGGYQVSIESPYLTFYVLLLLFMVLCTILSIHCLGWKLNRVLGIAMACLYAIFLTTAMIVEFTTPASLKF